MDNGKLDMLAYPAHLPAGSGHEFLSSEAGHQPRLLKRFPPKRSKVPNPRGTIPGGYSEEVSPSCQKLETRDRVAAMIEPVKQHRRLRDQGDTSIRRFSSVSLDELMPLKGAEHPLLGGGMEVLG